VRGYLYPPPNLTVRGGYSGLKGGGLSGPRIIRLKSLEISAPITGSKPPRVFTGGRNIWVCRGRIIRPPDNSGKIPSIFCPHYWEQTTQDLAVGGGQIIRPKIRPLHWEQTTSFLVT
jgi:hypothetical protein